MNGATSLSVARDWGLRYRGLRGVRIVRGCIYGLMKHSLGWELLVLCSSLNAHRAECLLFLVRIMHKKLLSR